MAPHDTFPQRVWHIVASIPEGRHDLRRGRPAGWFTARGAPGGRRIEAPAGRVHPAMASGGQSPWRYLLTGPDLQRQRQALLAEGVQVSGSGHIDLQHYRWVY